MTKAIVDIKDVGTIELQLFDDTPISTNNFIELANKKFYDGLKFHRIIPGFVAQGGCPDGNGMGGPGYNIKGEFSSNGFDNPHSHKKGSIAWARSMEKNSAGSQFYLTFADTSFLDEDYAVFGEITNGIDTLMLLEKYGNAQGTVNKDIIINSIKIV